MTTILKTQVRHRVRFAPDPENKAWPTEPRYVERRLIQDIEKFPVGVNYVTFDDVVETMVRLPNGEEKTLVSKPVNEDIFHVCWDGDVADKILVNHKGWSGDISVHPSLVGKVWVIAGRKDQADEQKALAA